MVNGKPRDSISADLRAGRPTISAKADALARRVSSLMSDSESEGLYQEIERHVARSPAWRAWVLDPYQHLAAFDGPTAATVEALLERVYERRAGRAKGPGGTKDDAQGSDA